MITSPLDATPLDANRKRIRSKIPLILLIFFSIGILQTVGQVLVDTSKSSPVATQQKLSKDDDSGSVSPIAQLLAPVASIGVDTRRKQVLAHIGSAIHNYRAIMATSQVIGSAEDGLHREEAISDARQAVAYALEYGRAEAKLIDAYGKPYSARRQVSLEGEAQKVETAQLEEVTRVAELQSREQSIHEDLKTALPDQAKLLKLEQQQIQDALRISSEFDDALARVADISNTKGGAGLLGDVERLATTVPDVTHQSAKQIQTTPQSSDIQRTYGITGQIKEFFELLGTKEALRVRLKEIESLHQEAVTLMAPLAQGMRKVVAKGQDISLQGAQGTNPVNTEDNEATFTAVEALFQVYRNAGVPLGQEIVTLEESRADLEGWQLSLDREYRSVLRSLLLRTVIILFALVVLFGLAVVWKQSTTKYVHDVRRRRQLMGMRRLVIGSLSTLVVLFGFVTQFKSLATFAGFFTAGLAVGLQSILLSVAAYFFIIGRYGVRVGDRVTIAGVTGDVIEVGLVRFYLNELGGSGSELDPTGRVAVFSNAVLFQAAIPLFKQIPGTAYVWHDLIVKLEHTCDYQHAVDELVRIIRQEYEGYRKMMEEETRSLELWLDSWVMTPKVEGRLQLVEGRLELLIRFPVKIRDAAKVDEHLTQSVLQLLQGDEKVRQAVIELPKMKAATNA